ncbi:MAG: hypothetical protein NT013_16795 [Planctomycetia bacterium]|nr:hypothetical protein [Planctomycetia bacterium]
MNDAASAPVFLDGGIQICGSTDFVIEQSRLRFLSYLDELGLTQYVTAPVCRCSTPPSVKFMIHGNHAEELAPQGDTTQLCEKLNLDTHNRPQDLEREILLAMLLCPATFEFLSYEELAAAVRVRMNIVEAARKTRLVFQAYEAERPTEYWTYNDERGFVLLPGQPLVAALQAATQPDATGKRYSFSCRRAVEYVVLLSLAQETQSHHSELFDKLRRQAESRALKGGEFERTFLRVIGSVENPLPLKYFVPGDRTWFRNPDQCSAEVTGYEGSWTFYLGEGRFTDFWKREEGFTLTTKCLSIYYWRHATYLDEQGELQMNEDRVEALLADAIQNPIETDRILQEMLLHQAPLGTFAGGCVEATREFPRQICRGTSDLVLPDVDLQS